MFGLELCLFPCSLSGLFQHMDLQITERTVMGTVDCSKIAVMLKYVNRDRVVVTGTACLYAESCESFFAENNVSLGDGDFLEFNSTSFNSSTYRSSC